jgi:hypothetical protein
MLWKHFFWIMMNFSLLILVLVVNRLFKSAKMNNFNIKLFIISESILSIYCWRISEKIYLVFFNNNFILFFCRETFKSSTNTENISVEIRDFSIRIVTTIYVNKLILIICWWINCSFLNFIHVCKHSFVSIINISWYLIL